MNDKDMNEDMLFWKKLAGASWGRSTSPLRSDEALAAFLKANPLSEAQEAQAAGAVERLRARLAGRKPEPTEPAEWNEDLARMSDAELVTLFRNQGTSTPEIERRLEALRKKVREEAEKKKKKQPGTSSDGAPSAT